jgi:hypothetical protein
LSARGSLDVEFVRESVPALPNQPQTGGGISRRGMGYRRDDGDASGVFKGDAQLFFEH